MDTQNVGKQRIERLQSDLSDRGIAAMICLKPENSFYLSGFNPIIYSHPVIAVLPASGDPVILVHALRDDHAHASAWVRDIRLYGAWGVKKTMGPNWLEALREILAELDVRDGTLGIEEEYLPLAHLKKFENEFPKAAFVDASDVIRKSRLLKEPYEIECACIAARLADEGMAAAISALAAGASDRAASVAAMAAMNRLWTTEYPEIEVCDFGSLEGGVHNGLWCWTLSGDRVLINTDNPINRTPRTGEIALILIWAVCNGIHAENERSVAIGPLGDEQRAAYEAVLEIRERTKGLMRPGMPVKEFYGAAMKEYGRLGYGPYKPGRIGHGIGLGAHESPSLDGNSEVVLEPNIVMTFEPNLRLPEWGGLQHSDTVLITESGCEFLTRTDNGFIQV